MIIKAAEYRDDRTIWRMFDDCHNVRWQTVTLKQALMMKDQTHGAENETMLWLWSGHSDEIDPEKYRVLWMSWKVASGGKFFSLMSNTTVYLMTDLGDTIEAISA